MTRRAVAMLAWLLTVVMTAAWVWVIAEGEFMNSMMEAVPAERQESHTSGWWVFYVAMAGLVILTLANATIGLLLALRRGGGRMGAILLAAGVAMAAVGFGFVVGDILALRDPLDPVANALFLIGPASYALAYSLILPVVALAFPDGRVPSPRWRWPSGLALGALAAAAVLVVIKPGGIEGSPSNTNPLGIDILPGWLTGLAGPLNVIGSLSVSVLGVAAVVTRYRRGSGLERQQLRWLVAAVLLAVVPFAISIVGGGVNWIVIALPGIILVPVAVWIAVTRHRLYDIDRLISRGASWTVLSALLVAVYIGAILVLQGVLGGVTQGETLAVAGSTLVAAALFQPLRRRIQAAMDHRFNRTRYDAQQTASAFAGRLRDQIDLDSIVGEMRSAVGSSVQPANVTVWIRSRNETRTLEA